MNKLSLKVKGMYENVKTINFGNELSFITDDKIINAIGSDGNTPCHTDLNSFLSYLDYDILNPSMDIDPNIFNTEADYFILIDY